MPSYITPSDQLFEVLCHPGKFIFFFFHFHQILWLTVVNKSNRKNNQLKISVKGYPSRGVSSAGKRSRSDTKSSEKLWNNRIFYV